MPNYRLMYRLGVRPWERYSLSAAAGVAAMLDREEAERGRPLGRALDLGCGHGLYTRELARRGWQSVGVDAVPGAIESARAADARRHPRSLCAPRRVHAGHPQGLRHQRRHRKVQLGQSLPCLREGVTHHRAVEDVIHAEGFNAFGMFEKMSTGPPAPSISKPILLKRGPGTGGSD